MNTDNNTFTAFRLAPFVQVQRPKGGPFLTSRSELNTSDKGKDVENPNVKRVVLKRYQSPEEVVHSHPDINENRIDMQQDYLETQFVLNLMKAAESLSTYSVLFDDLNIHEYKEKAQVRPNVAYMSPVVADAFCKKHEVEFDDLEDMFRRIYGLDLVVENKVGLNREGDAEFIVGNTVILAYVQPGSESSCLKTIYDGSVFFRQVYEDDKVRTEATYSIEVMEPQMGLRIDVQM